MPAGQGIAIRGQNVGSATASFATKPATGSAIVVGVAGRNTLYDANYSTSTITDTGNNTYTKKVFFGDFSIYGVELWLAENVSVPAGTWTLTLTCSKGTNQYLSGFAQEWVGALTTASADKTAVGNSSAVASVATGSTGALSQADEVAFSALCLISDDTDSNIVQPAGWTLIDAVEAQSSYTHFGLASLAVTTTTALAPSWSFDTATYHCAAAVLTLKTTTSTSTVNVVADGELPSVNSITLETPAAAIAPGATDILDITVLDDQLAFFENATPTVSATPAGIVTLGTPGACNASGVAMTTVTGVGIGTAFITATCGGVSSNSVPITVTSGTGAAPVFAIRRGMKC